MSFHLCGLEAYVIDANTLRESLTTGRLPFNHTGSCFTRFYAREDWSEAYSELRRGLDSPGSTLSELGSCAFMEFVYQHGMLNSQCIDEVSFPVEEEESFLPFARTWFPKILGIPDAYVAMHHGGYLSLKGSGRFAFGSLANGQVLKKEWEDAGLPDDLQQELGQDGEGYETVADSLVILMGNCQQTIRDPAKDLGRADVVFLPFWIEVG